MTRPATTCILVCFVATAALSLADIANAQARRGHHGPSSAHAAQRDHNRGPGAGRPDRPGPSARPPGGRPPGGRPPGGRPDHNRPPGGGHRPPPPHHIDVDVDHHWDRRWDRDYDVWDAVGTAAAVTATVAVTNAVIGSVTRSLPPSCVARPYSSLTYYYCGDTWYQPRYYGSNVEYVVVERPY
ncbi:hypothetical protein [Brevundimonas sp.]|uniref:hypothetical protein n=1 Tax=Brevundimonas sp. TaxID=1871086 RepID=UPI0028A04142|nr:hypothetical protein [Brevundimonas sp.]